MNLETCLCADGHAHIYPEFALDKLFRVGLRRAAQLGRPLLLLLTESAGLDYFGALRDAAAGAAAAPPRSTPDLASLARADIALHRTEEPESLAVRQGGRVSPELYLVAGRQFVSVEHLEVHALALDPAQPASRLPDHVYPAEELLRRILATGAAAVLPWGVGKWMGARGEEVVRLATMGEFAGNALFFLGDTASRCWPWPAPAIFRRHARVLPGTDILPLRGAEVGLASYGFRVCGRYDPGAPARSLLELLRGRPAVEPYGRRQIPLSALIDQFRYRLRRRGSRP